MTSFTIWLIGYWFTVGFLDKEDKKSSWIQLIWSVVWPVFWGRTIYDILKKDNLLP